MSISPPHLPSPPLPRPGPALQRPAVAARCGAGWAAACWALGLWAAALPAAANELPAAVVNEALALARSAAERRAPPGAKVQVEAGALDARLRLAPCDKVEPYLPAGVPATGRTRVGLRCTRGVQAWNVTLPVQVQVRAKGWVVKSALPTGARLTQDLLAAAEIDWQGDDSLPWKDVSAAEGRVLARPLAAGQAVRGADLQPLQWFASGAMVQVVARGAGFSVATEAQALNHGIEGQTVRVRTESGRILMGRAVGPGRVEVTP